MHPEPIALQTPARKLVRVRLRLAAPHSQETDGQLPTTKNENRTQIGLIDLLIRQISVLFL